MDTVIPEKWLRFINYVIDGIFIIASMVLVLPENLNDDLGSAILLGWFFCYYFFSELFFGKTLGKLITKSTVVSETGEKPTMNQIVIRSLSRLIPFDNFSFLLGERGWHDKLSKTEVEFNRKRD